MHELGFLRDLVVIFGGALVVVLVLGRLRLPTIAGFLLAGALMGPAGLGWVRDAAEVESLAEIGIVLLLFTIGLEFSLGELRRLGRVLSLGGGLQVGLTTLVVIGLASLLGWSLPRGTFLGFVVALSSTAIVLKGLAERGETDAPHGRLIVGVLLFQDLCVVPMLLLTPMLAGRGGGPAQMARALLTAAAVVLGTLVLARQVVPRALHLVAATRRRDLFVLAVVTVCAGIGWATSLVGLSLALGAFLAGVVLADSEYGHQALADVLPLRDIFTSLFFVSMGMLLDLRVLAQRPAAVLVLVAAVLAGKALLAAAAGLAVGFPPRAAVLAGLALAQVGEFSFVLARLGGELGLLAAEEARLLFAAAIVSMLVAPFALRFGPSVVAGAARFRRLERLLRLTAGEVAERPEAGLAGHVVVLGYGVGGEMLAQVLREAGSAYAVLDVNAERVREARRRGEPVYYGDATSREMLELVGVGRALQVAVLLNDPDAGLRAVRSARALAPEARILARARYVADVQPLLQAGATEVVAQEFEASLEIIGRVMDQAGGEAGPGVALLAGRLPRGLTVQSFAVRQDAWIVGRSLGEAQLRARSGASLVGLSRGEASAVIPAADAVLAAGDVLCLAGDPRQVAAARFLLDRGPAAG